MKKTYYYNPEKKRAYYEANKERIHAREATPERRAQAKKKRQLNRENTRALAATPERRAKKIERDKEYARLNPEKAYAHYRVKYALRTGALVRMPCETCGVEPTHGHHDDYSKPLDVRWLCVDCHKRHHRLTNEAESQ